MSMDLNQAPMLVLSLQIRLSPITFVYEIQGRHTLVCWNPLVNFHLIIVSMLSLVLKATVLAPSTLR